MNSPLRNESEEPDRDGSAEQDSAPAETEPTDGADSAPLGDEADPVTADGPRAETGADADADGDTGADIDSDSEGAPDLGLVEGAGDPPGDSVRPVEFAQIDPVAVDEKSGSIEMLMDIKLPISVELGRTETFVRDILEYGTGSVIELDKVAGDPVDILVNGRLVAKGEVVVVDDHFGVRITLLLTAEERVRSLG